MGAGIGLGGMKMGHGTPGEAGFGCSRGYGGMRMGYVGAKRTPGWRLGGDGRGAGICIKKFFLPSLGAGKRAPTRACWFT